MRLNSSSARLYLEGDSLAKAELEGDIVVAVDKDVTVKTDLATYDAAAREISAPGPVVIQGKGFEVKGVGLDFAIDEQIVKLSDDVYSYFEPDAEAPGGLAQ